MTSEKLKLMINEYFDGELDKKAESSLFVLLSQNDDAREYFKSLNIMEATVRETLEELPMELEERILRSLDERRETKLPIIDGIRLFPKVSYAFVFIILILSTYFFLKLETYQDRIETISNHLVKQSHTIEVLYNNLPTIEVNGKLDNKIIINSNL